MLCMLAQKLKLKLFSMIYLGSMANFKNYSYSQKRSKKSNRKLLTSGRFMHCIKKVWKTDLKQNTRPWTWKWNLFCRQATTLLYQKQKYCHCRLKKIPHCNGTVWHPVMHLSIREDCYQSTTLPPSHLGWIQIPLDMCKVDLSFE